MGLSSWRIEVVDKLIRPEEIRLKGSPGPTSQAVSVFNVNVRKESQRITSSAGPDMTHQMWHQRYLFLPIFGRYRILARAARLDPTGHLLRTESSIENRTRESVLEYLEHHERTANLTSQ